MFGLDFSAEQTRLICVAAQRGNQNARQTASVCLISYSPPQTPDTNATGLPKMAPRLLLALTEAIISLTLTITTARQLIKNPPFLLALVPPAFLNTVNIVP